eukprot:2572670-Amphidinium_carterae.1
MAPLALEDAAEEAAVVWYRRGDCSLRLATSVGQQLCGEKCLCNFVGHSLCNGQTTRPALNLSLCRLQDTFSLRALPELRVTMDSWQPLSTTPLRRLSSTCKDP